MKRLLRFFIPKEEKFYDMLIGQSRTSLQAVHELHALVKEYNRLNASEKKDRIKKIHALENQCDHQTHAIIDTLHTSFITPIDREDIHELAQLLDDQIDHMDRLAKKLERFHVNKVPETFVALVTISERCVRQSHEAVTHLRKQNHIKPHLIKIHDLEEEADTLFGEAIQDLFENGNDPLEVIKLKDLYENAEAIANNCQAVGILIEGIVVKHA
ncbi:DUF47 family protein [Candidatus Micrarchaeota archaeon]|nr:DUF47 family protein [Candidatus Micrarchaeota archaeon]